MRQQADMNLKTDIQKMMLVFLRVAVGCIFAYAGFMKLLSPVENFEAAILDYGVFPVPAAKLLAHIIPWIEAVGGTFLALGYLPRQSAATISLLALSFIALLGFAVLSGKGGEDCGCFGESGIHLTTSQMLALDLCSFLASLGLIRQKTFPLSLHEKLT